MSAFIIRILGIRYLSEQSYDRYRMSHAFFIAPAGRQIYNSEIIREATSSGWSTSNCP